LSFLNFSRPLLAGILHSFEPDHITAVSVLASEQAIRKKKISFGVIFRASQWALGHSVTLLIFGGIALAFKASLHQYVTHISEWAELAVGPIMILLGIKAILSNRKMEQAVRQTDQAKAPSHVSAGSIHLHGKNREVIPIKPLTRSFWIGMIHGLAGTGGALTTALVISAATIQASIMVLVIESAGIIITMSLYSYVLISTMSRYLKKNLAVFLWINGLAGLGSVAVGCLLVYKILA
jgi:nickel/cobalt exporter